MRVLINVAVGCGTSVPVRGSSNASYPSPGVDADATGDISVAGYLLDANPGQSTRYGYLLFTALGIILFMAIKAYRWRYLLNTNSRISGTYPAVKGWVKHSK